MINLREYPSGIAVAPTVVLDESQSLQLDARTEAVLPATALLRLDSGLNVVDSSGAKKLGLQDKLEQLNHHVIPGFFVPDARVAEALAQFLGANPIMDAFVVAPDPEDVVTVRTAVPMMRGVVDLRLRPGLSTGEIRHLAGLGRARVVILPQASVSRRSVEELQRLLISVWVSEERGVDHLPEVVGKFNLIATGANGIVTEDLGSLIEILGSKFDQGQITLVRKPFIIGHRGAPSLAPENTLAGARLAFGHGADMIENDVHLSLDSVVMVHHDDTLERTTTGTGPLNAKTHEELSSLQANVQMPEDYPDEGIPTLQSYLTEFRDRDMVHVIEIKSPDPAVVSQTAALLAERSLEAQAVFISFHPGQLLHVQEVLPGTSAGLLTAGQVNESEPLESVRRVLEAVQPLSATYHPRAAGIGSGFLEAARHRGITVWPWTVRDHESLVELFLAGASGITTDYSQWLSEWISDVETPAEINLRIGETEHLRATVRHYGHMIAEAQPELVVISGQECITVTGAGVTGVKEGDAWLALRCWQEVAPGRGYFMISAAGRVTVSAD